MRENVSAPGRMRRMMRCSSSVAVLSKDAACAGSDGASAMGTNSKALAKPMIFELIAVIPHTDPINAHKQRLSPGAAYLALRNLCNAGSPDDLRVHVVFVARHGTA